MAKRISLKIKNGKLVCNNRGIKITFKKTSTKKLKDILKECGID